jgi:hypothetical protein
MEKKFLLGPLAWLPMRRPPRSAESLIKYSGFGLKGQGIDERFHVYALDFARL